MDIFNQYATNEDAEQTGVWCAHSDGAEFLIARLGNARYSRMLSTQYEAHKHTLDLKSTPEEIAAGEALSKAIMVKVASRSILLGWRGPKVNYKGKPLPFSPENAEMILQHKDFAAWVTGEANKLANYLQAKEAEESKNSEPTTPGSSTGVVSSTS